MCFMPFSASGKAVLACRELEMRASLSTSADLWGWDVQSSLLPVKRGLTFLLGVFLSAGRFPAYLLTDSRNLSRAPCFPAVTVPFAGIWGAPLCWLEFQSGDGGIILAVVASACVPVGPIWVVVDCSLPTDD